VSIIMKRLIMLSNLEIPNDLTDADAEYVSMIIGKCNDPERLKAHQVQLSIIKDRLYKEHAERIKNGG